MQSDFESESETTEATVFKTRSPYQTIELTQLSSGEHVLYLDGNVQFVSGIDDAIYHGTIASVPAKMLRGKPARALILGGGDGLAARNLLKFPNIVDVKMVELDPGMIKFSSTHPVMRQINQDVFRNPKLQVVVQDATKWVKRGDGKKYDLAIIDFPDPTEETMNLFSVGLYEDVLKNMTKMPILSVQSSGALSDTEMLVKENLSIATGTTTFPARFRGKWMVDGTITYAGKGMVRSMAKVPARFASREAKEQATKGLF